MLGFGLWTSSLDLLNRIECQENWNSGPTICVLTMCLRGHATLMHWQLRGTSRV